MMGRTEGGLRALALAALGLLAACHADREQRAQTFAAAGRVDRAIADGAVVRDLRGPGPLGGGVLYSPPTNLAAPSAATTVSSPFGIATPDTARARTGTRPGAPEAAPAGRPGSTTGTPPRPATRPPGP